MNQAINTCIAGLNNVGQGFWDYAAGIFIQSSVLIILLLAIDFLLRKRTRAVFRYCLWMLLFVKLVLPASLALPTGIGYWLGDFSTNDVSTAKILPQAEEVLSAAMVDMMQGSIPLETSVTPVLDVMNEMAVTEIAITEIGLEPICWQGLVFLGWVVGMLVLLALLVQRICFVKGLIAQSKPANERLLGLLDECRSQIGLRQNIELRLSDNALSPAVCGLFKPIILIPATLCEKLSREKLQAVLVHELAHIKRADIWINLMQTMLQIVYFYNPLVWIANAMVRTAREQAVDEMVLVTLKSRTESYSNTLIDVGEMACWKPNFSLRLIGVVESKKALERRIKHMLNRPIPKSSKLGFCGLLTIIIFGAIILPMARADKNPTVEKAEHKTLEKQERYKSNFKATLSDGTTVKLLAVMDYYSYLQAKEKNKKKYPEATQKKVKNVDVGPFVWWAPNGKSLASSYRLASVRVGGGTFYFVLQTEGKATCDVIANRPELPLNFSSTTSVYDSSGKLLSDTSCVFINGFPKKEDIATLNVGVASGKWKNQQTWRFDWKAHDPDDIVIVTPESKGALLTWPRSVGNDIIEFVVSHTFTDVATRITGKDKNGKTHVAEMMAGGDAKGLTRRICRIKGIKLKELDSIEFQTRPYEWIEFKNVSLKSGHKTDVKVKTETTPSAPQPGNLHIPSTSTINKQGHIVDKIDYPFVNDSQVLGTWKSVDFVSEMEQFKAGEKQWKGRGGELFLNDMIFEENGKLICKNDKVPNGYPRTWTKGLVISDDDTKTASKYHIKEIDGSEYMFCEWKSGDYTFRYRKPSYYVLKKE